MELNCSSDGLMAVLQTVMELATEITQSKLSSWFPWYFWVWYCLVSSQLSSRTNGIVLLLCIYTVVHKNRTLHNRW